MANPSAVDLRHLPPHLREICKILAAGLLRLRSRTPDEFTPDLGGEGDVPLHFTAEQSVCADRTDRRRR